MLFSLKRSCIGVYHIGSKRISLEHAKKALVEMDSHVHKLYFQTLIKEPKQNDCV